MHACMALVTPPSAPPSTCPDLAAPLNTSSIRVPLSSHEDSLRTSINGAEPHICPPPNDLAAPIRPSLELPSLTWSLREWTPQRASNLCRIGYGGANQEPKGATQGSGGARPYYRPVLQCCCHPASKTTCSSVFLHPSHSMYSQVVSLSLVLRIFIRLFHFHLFHCKWKNRLKHKVQCVITEADFTTLPYVPTMWSQTLATVAPTATTQSGAKWTGSCGRRVPVRLRVLVPMFGRDGLVAKSMFMGPEETRYGDEVPSRWSRSIVI